MYSIVLEDDLIYDDRIQDKAYTLINPVLEMEDSEGGSLTFTVPPVNKCYSYLDDDMLRTMVFVYKGGTYTTNSIWQGRIIAIDTDIWNQKKLRVKELYLFLQIARTTVMHWLHTELTHRAEIHLCTQLFSCLKTQLMDTTITSTGRRKAEQFMLTRFGMLTRYRLAL